MNRPHARNKRIIDKKVKVVKKPIDSNNSQNKGSFFDIIKKLIKK